MSDPEPSFRGRATAGCRLRLTGALCGRGWCEPIGLRRRIIDGVAVDAAIAPGQVTDARVRKVRTGSAGRKTGRRARCLITSRRSNPPGNRRAKPTESATERIPLGELSVVRCQLFVVADRCCD